jgi:hypothetical protein
MVFPNIQHVVKVVNTLLLLNNDHIKGSIKG